MIKKSCDLESCFMCRFSLKEWLPAIATNKKNFLVKKGQALFNEGDAVAGIYFVYSGILKVHKKWGAEKDLILRFAKAGDIVGQLGLGSNSVYPVSATALNAATVCFIPMAFFESTLTINNTFMRNLMAVLANDLQESEKRMRNLAHMPVKGRVAQALISLKNQFGITAGGHINVELTRQDLASFTGAAYESLFRVINELTEEKLLSISGKDIAIVNEENLFRLTEETGH